MNYTLQDLHRCFGRNRVDAARWKLETQTFRVQAVEVESWNELFGSVLHGGQDLRVYVSIDRIRTGAATFRSHCSCRRRNCAHVPALLLALQHGRHGSSSGNRSGTDTTFWMDSIQVRLEELDRLDDRNGESGNAGSKTFVVYLLSQQFVGTPERGRHARVQIEPVKVRRLKRGGYSKPEPCGYQGNGPMPQYLTSADRRLFALIQSSQRMLGGSSSSQLVGEDAADLLERLLPTGRCYWQEPNDPALTLGPRLSAQLDWTTSDTGIQEVRLCVDGAQSESAVVLHTEPFWYVDPEAHVAGPLELPENYDIPLIGALLTAPLLDPEAAEHARDKMQLHPALSGLPAPRKVPQSEPQKPILPIPHLRLRSHAPRRQVSGPSLPILQLSFRYDERLLHADTPGIEIRSLVEGALHCVPRQMEIECSAEQALVSLGLEPIGANGEFVPLESLCRSESFESQMLELSRVSIPALQEQGWEVEYEEGYPYRVLVDSPSWYADLEPSDRANWFDLDLGIEVDGRRHNLLPVIVRILEDPEIRRRIEQAEHEEDQGELMVRLETHDVVPIALARIRAIVDTLVELYGQDPLGPDARLALTDWNAPQLETLRGLFDAEPLAWSGGERLRTLGKAFGNFSGLQRIAPPDSFRGALRDYQRLGLDWLQFLREHRLSGILADDMGLGKTVQILAHLTHEHEAGRLDRPCLVVAPTSAVTNWQREAARFAPKLRTVVLQGPTRRERFKRLTRVDLAFTTYPLLSRDWDLLERQHWHSLILDEAQFVKNPRSKAAQCAAELKADLRICVTGTPVENHLGELWSLFHILMPGLLGNRTQFTKLFRTPIEKHGDETRQRQLVQRTRPFMLRRTKDQVALELPPKTEMVRFVELRGKQRDLYDSIRLAMHDRVRDAIAEKGLGRSSIVILDALLKLRQACCDPRLLKLKQAKAVRERAKLDELLEMLDELLAEGRKILLFSQFTSMLTLIEAELKERKLRWCKLTGRTRDRDTPIQEFQSGTVPLFLISLKAGGTALNLTAADTVIHYDPWWNPAVENQATDRAHRIGQTKPVFVYKLIVAGSVEEKMVAMQERKRALAEGVYAGREDDSMFTKDDLEALFRPLDDGRG